MDRSPSLLVVLVFSLQIVCPVLIRLTHALFLPVTCCVITLSDCLIWPLCVSSVTQGLSVHFGFIGGHLLGVNKCWIQTHPNTLRQYLITVIQLPLWLPSNISFNCLQTFLTSFFFFNVCSLCSKTQTTVKVFLISELVLLFFLNAFSDFQQA